MAYTPVTFVYGEVLTATKMNLLAANDASFHDGSGLPEITEAMLGSGSVTSAKLADNAVTSAKLADNAVTSAKISKTTLYSNSQGSTSFTLSASVLNFSYILIFFKTTDGYASSKLVEGGQNFNVELDGWQMNNTNGTTILKTSVFSFSGTSVGYAATSRHIETTFTTIPSIISAAANNVLITKVIGIA